MSMPLAGRLTPAEGICLRDTRWCIVSILLAALLTGLAIASVSAMAAQGVVKLRLTAVIDQAKGGTPYTLESTIWAQSP